jgi:hypothetical protein
MDESKKELGFMGRVRAGLSGLTHAVVTSIVSPIAAGAEGVMDSMDERVMRMEKRIQKKLSALMVIGFGAALLVGALFYFLRESLGWSNVLTFFSLGMTIVVIGLLFRVKNAESIGNSRDA